MRGSQDLLLLAPAVTVGETEGAMDSTSVFFGLFFCLLLCKKISQDNNFWYVGYFQVANGQVKIFLI